MKQYETLINYNVDYYVMVSDEDYYIYNDVERDILAYGDDLIEMALYLSNQDIYDIEINQFCFYNVNFLIDELIDYHDNKKLNKLLHDELTKKGLK